MPAQSCTLAGAQERQDVWAVCMLTWLQGQPATALQGLLPQIEPDKSSLQSSDRSITPGELNASPPSVSGRHQTASPSSSDFPSPPITKNSAHGQNSNQAGTHAASDVSASQSHGVGGSFQTGRHWDAALALDLLSYCLASGTATWPGQLPTLGQLCQLAVEASHALEVNGHPVMALEALQIAHMCCARMLSDEPSSSEPPQRAAGNNENSSQGQGQQQQQQVLSAWQDRLVTACLMRCLVDATIPPPPADPPLPPTVPLSPEDAQHFISQRWTLHRPGALPTAPLPNPNQWKKLAQQQLKMLSNAGVQINTDQAMVRLQHVYDSLLSHPLVEGEGATGAEAGGAGLFRSISGMSTMSTPRRNSALSRHAPLCCLSFHSCTCSAGMKISLDQVT